MAKRKQRKKVFKMRRPLRIALVLLLIFLIASGVWMLEHRRYTRQEIATEIERFAAKHRIPAALVYSVVEQESKFDSNAVGNAGEIGLMQLMPPGKPGAPEEWARVFKTQCPSRRQLFKIDCNINIGCWYLARALRRWRKYKHGTELALVEYNAGAKQAN